MTESAQVQLSVILMLDGLRQSMSANDCDHLIVFSEDPHLSEYTGKCDRIRAEVTGFTGSAGILALSTDDAHLWTDSRYHVQAQQQLGGSGITLMKSGLPNVPSVEDYLKDHIWEGQRVAFDHMTLSYDRYKKIRTALAHSVETVDAHELLRNAMPDLPQREFRSIDAMPEKASGKSITEKLIFVRDKIEKKYANGLSYTYIVSDLTSIMWLFNLRGSDIDFVPVAYSYAVITAHRAILYVARKMLTEDASRILEDADVSVMEYSRFYKDLEDIATDIVLADSFNNNARIIKAFDDSGIYKDCSDTVLIPKAVKNASEIEGMKNAHLKDAVTMIRFIKYVKEAAADDLLPDEYELGKKLDEMRLRGGAKYPSFKTICAYGKNGAVVHYTAKADSALKIRPEGFLLVDSGGQYKYEGTTDITRTISLGKLTEEEKIVYTTVLKGNLKLMDAVFPEGYKGVLLDAYAESPLWDEGLFCGHGIGHGVGHYLSVHESEARISRSAGERETEFFPGVIVSDEPGVYLEGKFGVRLENLLLTVSSDHVGPNRMCRFTPLTLVPFDKDAILFDRLSEKEKDILERYHELVWEKVSPLLEDDERIWLKEIIDIN